MDEARHRRNSAKPASTTITQPGASRKLEVCPTGNDNSVGWMGAKLAEEPVVGMCPRDAHQRSLDGYLPKTPIPSNPNASAAARSKTPAAVKSPLKKAKGPAIRLAAPVTIPPRAGTAEPASTLPLSSQPAFLSTRQTRLRIRRRSSYRSQGRLLARCTL